VTQCADGIDLILRIAQLWDRHSCSRNFTVTDVVQAAVAGERVPRGVIAGGLAVWEVLLRPVCGGRLLGQGEDLPDFSAVALSPVFEFPDIG